MARLDAELVRLGIARSRERAKEMIASGSITVNGRAAKKASADISENDTIESSEQEQYVGRGALKLEKAVHEFGLDLTGKTCLDIGASTGGFTEYMLKSGAQKVFAVDVGHGQLAPSLCADSRVVNMEGTDIRNVTAQELGGTVGFISVDNVTGRIFFRSRARQQRQLKIFRNFRPRSLSPTTFGTFFKRCAKPSLVKHNINPIFNSVFLLPAVMVGNNIGNIF